jgi:hypothetical protein
MGRFYTTAFIDVSLSGDRIVAYEVKPFRAKMSADSNPIPLELPVITATF